jgi:hypothetical protein
MWTLVELNEVVDQFSGEEGHHGEAGCLDIEFDPHMGS